MLQESAPSAPIAILASHGRNDVTIPANATPGAQPAGAVDSEADHFYYHQALDVVTS